MLWTLPGSGAYPVVRQSLLRIDSGAPVRSLCPDGILLSPPVGEAGVVVAVVAAVLGALATTTAPVNSRCCGPGIGATCSGSGVLGPQPVALCRAQPSR